jgi:glycosyltransferase involved in cell wall biosynthesis
MLNKRIGRGVEDRHSSPLSSRNHRIIIDGVIFHLQRERPAGISRVWRALLDRLGRMDLGRSILLLDRDGSAPKFSGLDRLLIGGYEFAAAKKDSAALQRICEAEGADLFVSTYYTYVKRTASAITLHDMIPEVLGWDMGDPQWVSKRQAIKHSSAFFAVSRNTRSDFLRCYPKKAGRPVYIIPNAAADVFTPHEAPEIEAFKRKCGLDRPYFMLTGHRWPQKNHLLFFSAFAALPDKKDYEVLLTGGAEKLEAPFAPFTNGITFRVSYFSDEDLSLAYAGAEALVYPSLYEGFGLPLLEAMQSGCPVITCNNSALVEVTGDAVLFVEADDIVGMISALRRIREPETRSGCIRKGLVNAARFSWDLSARKLAAALAELVPATMPDNAASRHVRKSSMSNS